MGNDGLFKNISNKNATAKGGEDACGALAGITNRAVARMK